MLAPHNTLWSTPDRCGDGRVLLQWAQSYSQTVLSSSAGETADKLPSFVGIDIDPDRIAQEKQLFCEAQKQGRIDSRLSVTFHCTNALEAQSVFVDATVIFLYLIPRGLRIKNDTLTQQFHRRVLTYMSPLPNKSHVRRELIAVPHQPGAAWPLYLYRFENEHISADDLNQKSELD